MGRLPLSRLGGLRRRPWAAASGCFPGTQASLAGAPGPPAEAALSGELRPGLGTVGGGEGRGEWWRRRFVASAASGRRHGHGWHGHKEGQDDYSYLYSLHATEQQQRDFLDGFGTISAASCGERDGETDGRQGGQRAPVVSVIEVLEIDFECGETPAAANSGDSSGPDSEEFSASCSACGLNAGPEGSPAAGPAHLARDFYEDFNIQNELVLRSAWFCSGAASLGDMRRKLEERVRFLSDLEEDGWQLDAVDDEYACLSNSQPKPVHERRLADAWEIAEKWERGESWEP